MKEILDFPICKRLYEAGVIVDDTIFYNSDWELIDSYAKVTTTYYPALTIVDWLDLIKEHIKIIFYIDDAWHIENEEWYIVSKSLKECVEQALTYLLNENLLWTDKK